MRRRSVRWSFSGHKVSVVCLGGGGGGGLASAGVERSHCFSRLFSVISVVKGLYYLCVCVGGGGSNDICYL